MSRGNGIMSISCDKILVKELKHRLDDEVDRNINRHLNIEFPRFRLDGMNGSFIKILKSCDIRLITIRKLYRPN